MSGRKGIKDDADARALVSKLDGLPLAISTAGAYLEHVTTSFAEYLRLYEASWLKLQRTSPSLSSYEDRSLYTAWQVTFDQIQNQNAALAQLLKLWAYFDEQDAWYGLLRHACKADDESTRKLAEDEISFNEAVRLLCEYGLAHPEPSLGQRSGSVGYRLHKVVHLWTISVLNNEWYNSVARLALTCVASEVPGTGTDKWWLLQQRLLQHAARFEHFIRNSHVDVVGMEWALQKLGGLFTDQGQLVEAEAMYSQALRGREVALGPKHVSTLDTANNLGALYKIQGKLVEAEAMYQRALQGYEKAWGPEHTSTLTIVNNLGNLYVDQGKLAEAEAMYQRALRGKEKVWGPEHRSTLDTVNNLSNLYVELGRLDEAKKMYLRFSGNLSLDMSLFDAHDASDLISVLSVDAPPSLTTNSTLSDTIGILKTAAQEFAEILTRDGTMKPLFPVIIERAGLERFKRNFFRLLKRYAVELEAEASSRIQSDAAQLVRSRANHIVHLIAGSVQAEETVAPLPIAVSKSDRELVLERYIRQQAQYSHQTEPAYHESIITSLKPKQSVSNHEDDVNEEDGADEPEKPNLMNLDEVKKFMLTSKAFQNLRDNFSHFVFSPEEVVDGLSQPTGTIDGATVTPYRLHWICSCGHKHYDDFVEIIPGSITKLVDHFQRSGVEALLEVRPVGSVFSEIYDSYLLLRNTIVHLISSTARLYYYAFGQNSPHLSTPIHAEFPVCSSSSTMTRSRQGTALPGNAMPDLGSQPDNASVSAQTATTQQALTSSQNYILLCSDEKRWLTTWEDLDVTEVKSDRELFEQFRVRLDRRKCWVRRCINLKSVQRISFIKFALRQDQEVDQLQLNQIPPQAETHYDFDERVPGYIPPIGNRYLMHRFSNIAHCRDSTYCLAQIPKRVGGRPQHGFAPDHFTAWGLYFEETLNMTRLCLCGTVAFVISLAFGVSWATKGKAFKTDFQLLRISLLSRP